MTEEIFYCTDEGQGFDHKCVTFFSGRCSRENRCKYQVSEYQLKNFKRALETETTLVRDRTRQKLREDVASYIDKIFGSHTSAPSSTEEVEK